NTALNCVKDPNLADCGSFLIGVTPWGKGVKLAGKFAKAGGKAIEKIGDKVRKWIGPGCKCFLAGTKVLMADHTTKNIETVRSGDSVIATDPVSGKTGRRTVTALIVTDSDKHFNRLTLATPRGTAKLTATSEHPFWSPSKEAWVRAGDLREGMTLRSDDGTGVKVAGNRSFDGHARTYNLSVADLHTYYVLAGATPILVHNSNCLIGSPIRKGIFGESKAETEKRVNEVVDFFDMHGRPPSMTHQGGRRGRPPGEYGNTNGQLPSKPLGYYTESDVWPSGRGTGGRGTDRLVFGKTGEVYYTTTHYDNLIRVR
ncbi:polymorphic toxin-type HINT domain-containing protein, partial [Streptomyces monomycini]